MQDFFAFPRESILNTTEKFFIELLRSFVTGSDPKVNTDEIDEVLLLELCKRHSLQGVVAYMVNRCNLTLRDDTVAVLSEAYDRTLMQMMHREGSAVALCKKLSENNIPHILFKGLTISECYPVKELRTYGDVDILVEKKNEQPVRRLMASMGFKHSVTDEGVVNAYVKGRERYEFHTALNVSLIKGDEYFKNIWDHTVHREDETRMFDHKFHLSYLISHIEKHVYGSGAGIKMYLDVALYINKHRKEIDFDDLRETLRACGLEKFLFTVLYLCHRWFSLDIPDWVEALQESTYEQMCEFTLNGGVFGKQTLENNFETALRNELASGKKGAKLRVLLGRVFPSVYELYRMYPRYEGKALLVPVAWMTHVIHVLKDKKLGRIKMITSANVSSAEEKNAFFEAIGSKRG